MKSMKVNEEEVTVMNGIIFSLLYFLYMLHIRRITRQTINLCYLSATNSISLFSVTLDSYHISPESHKEPEFCLNDMNQTSEGNIIMELGLLGFKAL